jgi:hypothetical protein
LSVGRRRWEDRGKEIHRLRIALPSNVWEAIHTDDKRPPWDYNMCHSIERIVEEWYHQQIAIGPRSIDNGPIVDVESGPVSDPPEFPIYQDSQGREHGEF